MTNIERRKIVEAKCLLKEGNDAKYKKGDIVHFKNGEEWLIRNVKENLNKLTIKPYNKIAKNNYISLEIDVDFSFLDKNKVIVKQKAQELAEAEGNLDDEIPKELSNLLKQIREFGGELIYLNRRRYTDGVKGLAPKTSSLRSKVAKLKKQIENQFPRWEVVESYSYPYYFLSDKEAAELKENKSTINKRKKLVMTNVEKKRIVETTIKTLKKKGLLKEYIKDLENELEGSDISEKCKEVWEGYFFDSVDEFDEIMITEGLDAPGSEIAEKYGLDNDNFMWGGQIKGNILYLKFYYHFDDGTKAKDYELKKLLIQIVKNQFSEQALGLMKASWSNDKFPELDLKLEFKDFVKAVREGIFHLNGN